MPRLRVQESLDEVAVITIEDCIAFCGLTEQEVLAIAEMSIFPRLRLPPSRNTCLARSKAPVRFAIWFCEDIRAALDRADTKRASELCSALRRFLESHPEGRCPKPPPAGCQSGKDECFRFRQ